MTRCVLAVTVLVILALAASERGVLMRWSSWSSWSGCVLNPCNCGSGYFYRYRRLSCRSGYTCRYARTEKMSKSCHKCCPVNCSWNSWGSWGSCSKSCCCGGTQTRRRTKRRSQSCGGTCYGSYTSTRSCPYKCCPRDCRYGSWSSWSSCYYGYGKKCGTGTQTRSRSYTQTECGGKPCKGPTKETRTCSKCCPVDCAWNSWGKWGSCSKSCGLGVQRRSRGYARLASCAGKSCNGSSEAIRSCSKPCCIKKDCIWASWGSWGSCSKSCGSDGIQARKRLIARSAECCGSCPGSYTSTRRCPYKCCPRDCRYGNWSSWSSCDFGNNKTCGEGNQTRSRSRAKTAYCGGKPCKGPTKETKSCSKCCPADCEWDNWGRWSICSRTCGSGVQYRKRAKAKKANCGGIDCDGKNSQVRTCNSHCCPRSCSWSRWGTWSSCSTIFAGFCGRIRTRFISKVAYCGGSCGGWPFEKEPCDKCPY